VCLSLYSAGVVASLATVATVAIATVAIGAIAGVVGCGALLASRLIFLITGSICSMQMADMRIAGMISRSFAQLHYTAHHDAHAEAIVS